MGKKLYVGNLSYSVKAEDLSQMFAQHGQVESATVITDKLPEKAKASVSLRCRAIRKPRLPSQR